MTYEYECCIFKYISLTFSYIKHMGTKIIDFHMHILPGMDDGSRNAGISREMLAASAEQGVGVILATPHFYASRDRVDRFLEERERSREFLVDEVQSFPLQLRIGAEVAFFRGISGAEKIDSLTIEGTNLLLLEMPFQAWTRSEIEEVEALAGRRGFRVLLAHIERYLDIPGNRRLLEELLELPVYAQVNAESLTDWRKRGRLIRMFRDGQAHVLGSDSHGMHHRPPNLADGRAVLEKKLGPEFLEQMDLDGCRLLGII